MKNWPKLKPHQEELLKGLRKGALTHIHMSRGTGKSMAQKIAYNQWKLKKLQGEKDQWSDWKKGFALFPKRCEMTDKWIIGRICIKTRTRYVPWTDPNGKVKEKRYASMKEVFKRSLNGTL
jgi:hypothetical protein